MSHTIRHIRIPVLSIYLLLWMAGCLKEDNTDCPRGLYVCLIPENPKHDLRELFRTADLYFYEETGDLAFRLSYGRDGLMQDGKTILTERIPHGKYTLVSLINDVDHYQTINDQRFESLQTCLKNEVSEERLVDFFSGVTEVNVIEGDSPQEVDVDIFKHNNDIKVEVIFEGFEIPQGSVLKSYIEGNNGEYDYKDGTSLKDSYRMYQPYRTGGSEIKKSFDFSVMRLWRDSDLTLCIQEVNIDREVTGSVELNITDELARVVNDNGEFLYDNDKKLSFHDEFKMQIKLRSDLSVVELIINDWSVIGGGIDV